MKRGFTLIELVLVLTILSLLALVAVRQMGDVRSELASEKSNEILRNITLAIVGGTQGGGAPCGDGWVYGRSGERIASSFIRDIGRLPRAWTNAFGELTLEELFVRPNEPEREGKFLPAYDRFSCSSISEASRDAGIKALTCDANQFFGWGWRGPYLSTARKNAAAFIGDGWKNPLVSHPHQFPKAILPESFEGDYYLPYHNKNTDRPMRLFDSSCMTNGMIVAGIRHLGANGLEDLSAGEIAAINNAPTANGEDRYVFFNQPKPYQGEVRIKLPTTLADGAVLRLYGPNLNPSEDDLENGNFIAVYAVTNSTSQEGIHTFNFSQSTQANTGHYLALVHEKSSSREFRRSAFFTLDLIDDIIEKNVATNTPTSFLEK